MSLLNHQLELLAPARDADIGIAAIHHGADAVYIGAPAFGARASATNTLQDIERLCKEAHRFNSKIFITLNTILRDDELEAAQKNGVGCVPRRRGCAHRARLGVFGNGLAPHSAARQHANRHSHA
jgi:hypothetical protein